MSDDAVIPTLEIDKVTVTVSRLRPAPTLHTPRDLPDLARFLWSSVARGADDPTAALIGIELRIDAGCLAVIGEEGAGKSALVMLLARVLEPTTGEVRLRGTPVHGARNRRERLEVRRRLQVVLDDVTSGLDPRLTVAQSFSLFLRALRLPAPDRDAMWEVLRRVDLGETVLAERAEALGRGEAKRAAIARALLASPAVLVLDEPTRGLDPIERMAVLSTIARLVSQCVVVVATRDIALARAVATRVAVLARGELVEVDEADRVFFAPGHEVTRGLVASAPSAPRPAAATS